jgi:hypothetical protein
MKIDLSKNNGTRILVNEDWASGSIGMDILDKLAEFYRDSQSLGKWYPMSLTPQEARSLGEALIKAAEKYEEKEVEYANHIAETI